MLVFGEMAIWGDGNVGKCASPKYANCRGRTMTSVVHQLKLFKFQLYYNQGLKIELFYRLSSSCITRALKGLVNTKELRWLLSYRTSIARCEWPSILYFIKYRV